MFSLLKRAPFCVCTVLDVQHAANPDCCETSTVKKRYGLSFPPVQFPCLCFACMHAFLLLESRDLPHALDANHHTACPATDLPISRPPQPRWPKCRPPYSPSPPKSETIFGITASSRPPIASSLSTILPPRTPPLHPSSSGRPFAPTANPAGTLMLPSPAPPS